MPVEKGAPAPWDRRTQTSAPSTGKGTLGGAPTHFHDASAIVSGILAGERLEERIQDPAPYEADNADLRTETGFWSAHILTANMPASSQWVCVTIRSGADTVNGNFLVQVAFEVNGTYRRYSRVCDVVTWSSWVSF